MQDWMKIYAIPLSVSGAGLVIAAGLALAPVLTKKAPTPVPVTVAETSVVTNSAPPVGSSQLDTLNANLAAQAGMIDALNNRITTLEKGITRLNERLIAQSAIVDSVSNISGQLNSMNGQLDILNVAVPRLNARLRDQASSVENLGAVSGQIQSLQGQIDILNKAVPRVNARVTNLRSTLGSSDTEAPAD